MPKPVIVIRKLEDSPDWLDRRLPGAYLSAIYRVCFPADETGTQVAFDLRPGSRHPGAFGRWLRAQRFDCYAVITAWNPASVLFPTEENRQQNERLGSDLRDVSSCILPGVNLGTDGSWPEEESFFAFGISAGQAIFLGRKYRQNAIVWWRRHQTPELWWL